MPSHYLDDLRLAHQMADQVDQITAARFGADDLAVQTKADQTPVSDADQAAEARLRQLLAQTRPADAIVGEEFGPSGQADRRWVLDPIDGTKNYVRGVPVWASLIALMDGPDAVLGLVSAPALGRRWFAATGYGAWAGPSLEQSRPLRVSSVARLDQAFLAMASFDGWAAQGRLEGLLALGGRVARTRGFGDFWSYMLLAEGAVDIACEPELAFHDMAAPAVIVREAGGRFTDTTGRVDGPFGSDALATNGLLHDAVLAVPGFSRLQ